MLENNADIKIFEHTAYSNSRESTSRGIVHSEFRLGCTLAPIELPFGTPLG